MVITAKEMYRKTMISSKAKELMDDVMKKIMKQSSNGHFALRMAVDDRNKNDHEIIQAVQNELIANGSKVKFDPVQPLPSGCPSDQWDFYAYFNVGWGKDVVEEKIKDEKEN